MKPAGPEADSPAGPRSESAAQRELKQLALAWARAQRLALAATEVRLPRSNYRAEGTKFARLARWRAASLLYLVAEENLFAPHEVPDGWDLLIRRGPGLELILRPRLHVTTPEERVALVERIAAVGSRDIREVQQQLRA